MLWVAVFALVCMAAVGVALVGITVYLLYALARHLFDAAVELLRLERREPEPAAEPPIAEPAQPVAPS
jgi:hypothetical protein